jgi:hypothetical protein
VYGFAFCNGRNCESEGFFLRDGESAISVTAALVLKISSSLGDSAPSGVAWTFCQNLDVLGFFLKLLTDISLCEVLSGDSNISRFEPCLSGEFELDLPRSIDIEVLSFKLGRFIDVAIVFDLLGTSTFPCAAKVCEGTVSGSMLVDVRAIPAIGTVAPGMLTPPTWRASKGAEMVLALGLGLVMAILQNCLVEMQR